MDVSLVALPADGAPTLEALWQLYCHDFSEILDLEVGEDGRFSGGRPLSTCWTEPWRHPFLLRSGGHIAGFAIIDERSRISNDPAVVDMAEFFVLRRHRRRGLGTMAACAAFALYPRRWEVRQTPTNVAATAFWRRAIAVHTGGAFTEAILDDERWHGPVQSFG